MTIREEYERDKDAGRKRDLDLARKAAERVDGVREELAPRPNTQVCGWTRYFIAIASPKDAAIKKLEQCLSEGSYQMVESGMWRDLVTAINEAIQRLETLRKGCDSTLKILRGAGEPDSSSSPGDDKQKVYTAATGTAGGGGDSGRRRWTPRSEESSAPAEVEQAIQVVAPE